MISSAAVSVAGQILEHYEKVQFMKKECGRCGRLVRTLVPSSSSSARMAPRSPPPTKRG